MYTDIFDILLQAGLLTSALVVYLIFFRKTSSKRGCYRLTEWNYPLKKIAAHYAVKSRKSKLKTTPLYDTPRPNQAEGFDAFTISSTAPDGSALVLGIKKLCGLKPLVEVHLFIKLQDGSSYMLPYDSKPSISSWENVTYGWSAGDLKIQVLEQKDRYRILFNGLLLRKEDGAIQHVKLNLIWSSASKVVRHPEDWSNELAAETLASEPWRDGAWYDLLSKCGEGAGSWLQFGAVQGRLQAFDENGKLARSEYLRTRGVKERRWAPTYKGIRRSAIITVAAKDGTVVNLQGFSYENNFTQCISGSVRMPDFSVQYITSTDLEMSEFCESADQFPTTYTINVNAGKRCLKLVLRISNDGSHLLSGLHQEYESIYRVVFAEINGECGSGILELGYERKDKLASPLSMKSGRHLKWLDLKSIKNVVKYCLEFEDPSAACVEYVGGKGASLALLSSVQDDEGFQVPPGFCITTKALDKYLELNNNVKVAIKDIESAGVEYQESVFKEKCNKAVELFLSHELSGELKEDIHQSLTILREKALKQYHGSELRFAVRSSAVGEDSEALSAAGQNETVLGMSSDDDVLRSVVKCWASMFAFTSAYYRRQNGQPCMCEGAVVVQVLVEARVAGVMFTRHPEAGDPSRIVITANYGLGESVVSGTVEPDTIIVKRNINGKLSIANIQLGSKSQRIVPQDNGVRSEDVPESDRNTACLFEDEILRLAQIGVVQDQLWRAGRDIEFAISKDGIICLLQARPITSLEAWSEEELLHELDFPVMSDDELITFANVGEVLPKPFTALTYDIVIKSMKQGMSKIISSNSDGYDNSIVVTHNRGAIALYNTVYRRVPKTIDINLRMLELSIHGHRVADNSILSTAQHRRQPRATDKLVSIVDMIKNLFVVKWKMNDTVKGVSNMKIKMETDNVLEMCNNVIELDEIVVKYFMNHGATSMASTFTQFIAMSVLLEGKSDFTPEQCNEISVMLNSGDVLSAEVPQGLATLAQMLEESGRVEEFRKEDPKEAMDWLKVNLPSVYEQVAKFLDQHGYRAIMEFELSTRPWVLVPEDLMKVLMQIVPSKDKKLVRSSDEVIASLKTPQKPNTRKALRWILPLCQRTVRYRESTKAHLILAIHKIRLAVIHLGHLMVQNWYLPRYDLVFYFRAYELKTFIETRDPALLKKAIQRQNYSSKWSKLKFAEMNKGWVEPFKTEGPKISSDGDVKVSGTSVCGGEIVARACVVRDLSEIDQLRQGDILITHATDIGWSPYFPLLSGIVTELGGLISHGAVIAREYGLPCIVGAMDATYIFKTGDNVRLSGSTGVVEKVCVENTEKSMNE